MSSTQQSETTSPARRATFGDVLRNQGFRNLWLGQVVSQIGDYFAFLAMMVVVSSFSNTQEGITLAVTGMTIAFALPRLLFGVLAGVFVDRWDRRRTMIVSDVLRTGLTLALIPALLNQNLWLMYGIGFVMSAVGTLFIPAKGALIPKLVPVDQLLAANSLSQTSQMLATMIGPALAGATFALLGNGNSWIAFVIDSLSYVVSAFAIWRIRTPNDAADRTATEGAGAVAAVRQVGRELAVGLRALVLNRTIAVLTVILGITMLGVGAVNVLFLVYLRTAFGFEAGELAWRLSIIDFVFAGGMIVSSVLVGNFLSNIAPKWLVVGSLIGAGVGLAVCTMLPNYWLFVAAQLWIGAFVAPINVGVGTLVQIVVPNNQLGRVGGGIGTTTEAASITSMSLAGGLGVALGIPMVFLIGGLMCIGGGLLGWAALPALTMKDMVEAAPEPAPASSDTVVLAAPARHDPQAV